MTKKKVLLRADGNTQIGLGHIYRCIAIAEMLQEDLSCEFLLGHNSQIKNIIPSQFPVKYIPASITLENESEWINENFDTKSLLIILDGYHFNADYQKNLKKLDAKLVYIDDLAKEHMVADAVINHAPSANATDYKKENYTKLFLGIQYAILRQGFLKKAKEAQANFKTISNVLITLGGSDEHNITLKILEPLLEINQIQKIDIIIGAAYPFKEQLEEKVKSSNKHIQLFSNLSELEMINLMSACDAAFAPCSTTCMELFAVNKPVFAGFSASNQIALYNYFKSSGLIFDLKNLQDITVKEIKELVEEKSKQLPEINKMLNLQKQLIDGRSGERIVALVKKLVE